jgi:DNA-binding transcriptional ArsR family regulator
VNNSPQLDRSFLALSHPVRRTILERLAEGPTTVGEAARGLPVSKSAISKHLKVLEGAGVIRRTVEGRRHRLLLEPRRLDEASRWLERHRSLWEAKFEAVERHLKEEGRDRER